MDSNNFFDHDTDEEIIQKRSAEELALWISDIEFSIDESDKLAQIASKVVKNETFGEKFAEMTAKNKNVLNDFIKYKGTMVNYKECEDFECDLFYINKHEDYRKIYAETVKNFRALKTEFYTEVLK
ncbi:hypothetical protein [Oceanihabitans sediminis]|uniref:Uncharacterized protein n=1 Tax=Oceanihabitans sediminis TaxID=1812012 RepID=A0A368P6I1_9FLAO|nr:hypothetical protein [Oceanihabitans sediminis]MDX1278470.1 hypothetical protein [Oceanihabitans sediminis]MDX1773548.1 hypothetical protein [Oceanihabitans sediminis]RBP32987.1 hypothetical protein DFR65_102323 [Oceanihabitans sediminis]RCU57495.1 hypothetical protein DU428_06780 [Oceanihabitans sediminis]